MELVEDRRAALESWSREITSFAAERSQASLAKRLHCSQRGFAAERLTRSQGGRT